MKRAARLGSSSGLVLLLVAWALAGCETTGDPRQGGLFGWSEAKARDRQHEREEQVSHEQSKLAGENARGQELEARGAATDRNITAANEAHTRAEAALHRQQGALLAKIDTLETESPTSATASRVRAYRRKVNTIVAQTAWPISQRSARLREMEAEVDAALARAKR
jgi:hypothetical protein